MNWKQLFLFFLLAFVQQLHAQRVKFGLQPVAISVNIKNPLHGEIVIDIRPLVLGSRSLKPQQLKVGLNKDNTATVDIPLKGPAIIKVMNVWSDSTMEYLVFPGTIFTLELDGENKAFVGYDPNWKNEDDFFNSMLGQATNRLKAIPQDDPIVFIEQWQKANHENLLLMSNSGGGVIRKQYREWVMQNIQTLSHTVLARQFLNYVTINEKWPGNIDTYFNSCEILSNSQLNDPAFFTSSTDEDFIAEYGLFAATREYHRRDKRFPPTMEKMYRTALENANKITAPATKKMMIQSMVLSVTKMSNDINFLKQLRSSLITQPNATYYHALIDARRDQLNRSPVGKPALGFEAQDANGVAFSFNKYAGKYIYIDVWATWCVPCKLQFPYLEQLKKTFEGKPIVFISMSVDKSKVLWEKYLASHPADSYQYISAAGLQEGIMNTYMVKYIPRFILIDKAGNMLNTNSFLPSDPALNMLLKKLLN